MARIVIDSLSHQAIREAGTEREVYGATIPRAGEWAGIRLAGFRALLGEMGDEMEIAPPTEEMLAGAGLLIVASRSQLFPFAAEALEAISIFVDRGGSLLLMGNHWGMVLPQQQLASALDLPVAFSNASIDGDPQIELVDHPVVRGISSIVVRNSCWLTCRDPEHSQTFARFRGTNYGFGVAMVHGRGRVVALGDSGFFASRDDAGRDMFASGDNARLFANILGWLRT